MENSNVKEATVTGTAKAVEPVKVGSVTTEDGKSYDIFRHTINRGQGIGNKFFGPDFSKLSLADLITLHGEDSIKDILISAYRPICNDISKEAVSEAEDEGKDSDENAILEIFKTSFKDLAVEGKSKSDLEDEQKEMLTELMKLGRLFATDPSKKDEFLTVSTKLEKIGKSIAKKTRVRKPKVVETAPVAQAA